MSRNERARALLASAGLLPGQIHYGHSPEVNRILDQTPCVTCGKPVGEEARGSAQCLPCLKAEIDQEEAIAALGAEVAMTQFDPLSDWEVAALKKLWAEPDDSDPDDGTKTLIHMRYLATIDLYRLERDAMLNTQGRIEHALYGILSGEYGWDGEDIDHFVNLFRLYLIPPDSRTLEQIAVDVERARELLMDAVAREKRSRKKGGR